MYTYYMDRQSEKNMGCGDETSVKNGAKRNSLVVQ